MAKKHNADYWNERFAALENSQYITSEAYCKDLRRQFSKATVKMQADIDTWYQRIAKNNGVSYAEAKKLLDQNQLKEFHWTVDEYIKYGKENGINQKWIKELENASAKVHISRLEAMKLQVRQHAEKLFAEYESGTSKLLNKTFSSGYYKTAFEIAKGTGVGSNLHRIDTRKIDTFIRQPWAQDGANFSDRIWKNKEKLMNTLHTELSQSIICGADQRVAIDHIARTMDVSKSAAETLVRTECAAITSEATKQCYKDLNLEKYEILATLDSRTSDICQDMDGKVFDMKDYEVGVTAPPFHPRCRTTTVPYYEDESTEGEERAARDEITGKTYYVAADMTYHEWEKQFVAKGTNSDIIKSRILDTEDVLQKFKDLSEDIIQGKDFMDYTDGNPVFEYISRKLGNDGLPKVVNHDKFMEFAKESPVGILYRGISASTKEEAEKFVEQFKTGKFFTGIKHAYGHGIYFSPDKKIAEDYAKTGGITKIALSKNAKVVDYIQILKEYEPIRTSIARKKRRKESIEVWEKLIDTVGEFAAVKGYDAIVMDGFNGNDHIIILNRRKVIVEK